MTRLKRAALANLLRTGSLPARSRRSKWRNIKVELDGHKFDSKKEARRYERDLEPLLQAGRIKNLRFQVWYRLDVNGHLICRYRADFVYEEDGEEIVEDVKGFKTPEYKLKAKLMLACHGIRIRET